MRNGRTKHDRIVVLQSGHRFICRVPKYAKCDGFGELMSRTEERFKESEPMRAIDASMESGSQGLRKVAEPITAVRQAVFGDSEGLIDEMRRRAQMVSDFANQANAHAQAELACLATLREQLEQVGKALQADAQWAEELRKATQPYADWAEEFHKAARPYAEMLDQLNKAVRPYAETTRAMTQLAGPLLDAAVRIRK
ncbi:MAG: hypothetical protein HY423_09220 [Candidatus Lambdaproteobacteria bacterium]|nr:hypothetical protein [Candidatus Lambdaproteobacteria bacterium]